MLHLAVTDVELRALTITVATTLLSGTLFYRFAEDWSYLDALYFSVMTLSTIGYGDLAPTTALSKVFTIFYVFLGVGLLAALVTVVRAARHQPANNAPPTRIGRRRRQGVAVVSGCLSERDLRRRPRLGQRAARRA